MPLVDPKQNFEGYVNYMEATGEINEDVYHMWTAAGLRLRNFAWSDGYATVWTDVAGNPLYARWFLWGGGVEEHFFILLDHAGYSPPNDLRSLGDGHYIGAWVTFQTERVKHGY